MKTGSKNRVGLKGIAHDDNSSFARGASRAPQMIRTALFSDSGNLWAENGEKLDFKEKRLDQGDINLNGKANSFELIQQCVYQLLEKNLIPVLLGGDHSITYPVLKVLAEFIPDITILHFDAHPDLYDIFLDNPLSHACPFARIMENNYASRLVQVGIRTFNGHQREQAKKFRVESFEMKDFYEGIKLSFKNPLYISIDMDVLDPSFAPGVSHMEPGGLSSRQLINLIQRIAADRIIGADLVEYNPDKDSSGITAYTAAKVLKELLGKIQKDL